MTTLAEQAVGLATAGWPVFPVGVASKRPLTPHGHLDATNDPPIVRTMFQSAERRALAAIATPTGNGLLVIDVDPRNGGRVPRWAPRTLSVRTQSGGTHLYYSIDGPWKSRAGLFGPGVDSKADGGYVLIPPSPGYEWVDVQPRTKLTTEWLLTKVAPSEQRGALHGATRLPPHEWRRGIIHDQVVAWAAYFARVMDSETDITNATWDMVNSARAYIPIDNARGHIDSAIRWVLDRERSKG